MGDALAVEEQRSLLSAQSVMPTPDTMNKVIKRVRLMTLKLLPVEVELDDISSATSSIITPEVIQAYAKSAGDFGEALPFCLLQARAQFKKDAHNNPADFDENNCRALACEILARRIVHNLPAERLESVMSTRFTYRAGDGDKSAPTSALESAIDQHATEFLSSDEAIQVINSLWCGDLVQVNAEDDQVDYRPYRRGGVGVREGGRGWAAEGGEGERGFWGGLDVGRLSVPRYQTTFSILIWLFFLFVYSQCVRTPLDSLDPDKAFDVWEVILYGMAASFFIEEVKKTFKTIRLTPKPLSSIGFWTVINFAIDVLLLTAVGLRIAGIKVADDEQSKMLHLRSFQVLSCVAPLIWLKLLTVFDGLKIVGVLQIVVFRMMRESAIFFILLGISSIGFYQAMYALDAADGQVDSHALVLNGLLQALLGSPDFDSPTEHFGYPFGLIIYYSYNILTTIILLNVLIALFGSAYDDISSNSTDEFVYGFAFKTIDLIRSPDSFVYVPPFNIIEVFLVAPLEFVLPRKVYARVNRWVMSVVFFIPLVCIALFESQLNASTDSTIKRYFKDEDEDDPDDENLQNPSCDDDDEGEISVHSFSDLIKVFPNTALSTSTVIQREIHSLKLQIQQLERLHHLQNGTGKEKDFDVNSLNVHLGDGLKPIPQQDREASEARGQGGKKADEEGGKKDGEGDDEVEEGRSGERREEKK